MDQITKVEEKISKPNPISRLGEWGVKGGPGRGKGSKNKFTLLKEQLIELWEEEGLKDRLRAEIKKPGGTLKVLDRMISVLPKEPLIDQSINVTNIRYQWGEDNQAAVHPTELPVGDTQQPETV